MAIDGRFINISDLESYFVDKTTGLPLASGYVEFYSATDHITPKPVYILTGTSPTTYSYVSIGSVVQLGIDGTPVYNNQSVTVFYFPYTGDPAIPSENVSSEYYFVRIYSSGSVQQTTRDGVPYLEISGSTPINETNLIPNSQFLAFNNNWPSIAPYVESDGVVTYNVYPLAQGGFEFAVSAVDATKYTVQQSRPATPSNAFSDVPYALIEFKNTVVPTGSIRELRFKFQNVYTFSSPTVTNVYTFYLAAQSNDGGSHTFNIRLLRYFGTGGTPSLPEYGVSQPIVITPTSAYSQVTISFDPITGKVLGSNNDDFIAIIIEPIATTFDVRIFESGLIAGQHVISNTTPLPPTLQSTIRAESIAGWMPTPALDGSDLYLPLRLTPTGMEFDHSDVGKVFMATYEDPKVGELLCDGTSYNALGYSPIGVPFARLAQNLWLNTRNTYIFGTGKEFIQSQLLNVPLNITIMIHANTRGAITQATDISTTMVINNITAGSNINIQAYVNSSNSIYTRDNAIGLIAATFISQAGTSPFTVAQIRNFANVEPQSTITCIMAGLTGGKYFILGGVGLPGVTPFYYIWYTVDGVGVDPAPILGGLPGIGIRVNVLSTYTNQDLTCATASAINGFCTTQVVAKAGGVIPQSSYFTIGTFSTDLGYVWFSIDGSGVDPVIANSTSIKVDILSGDTVSQVANKIVSTINARFVGVPDLRGLFIRGTDITSQIDSDALSRYSFNVFNLTGAESATYEIDANLNHTHSGYNDNMSHSNFASSGGNADVYHVNSTYPVIIDPNGESESRPRNISLKLHD